MDRRELDDLKLDRRSIDVTASHNTLQVQRSVLMRSQLDGNLNGNVTILHISTFSNKLALNSTMR